MILPLPNKNEREVFTAVGDVNRLDPENAPALTAVRLLGKGYPKIVAARVALTPPLMVASVPDDTSRPGRELRECVELQFGQVVCLVAAAVAPGQARR